MVAICMYLRSFSTQRPLTRSVRILPAPLDATSDAARADTVIEASVERVEEVSQFEGGGLMGRECMDMGKGPRSG